MKTVFIDGQEGTTGLKLYERLSKRNDIELLLIDPQKRKDTNARRELLNTADFVFLCLPDTAAIEAVSLIENDRVRVLDASTAHRIDKSFCYGFPELLKDGKQRDKIASSSRVSVPGCYASGFLSLAAPLVQGGIIPADYPLVCYGISGYSGGGKKMIAEYEGCEKSSELYSPRVYGLGGAHKHLPEMRVHAGLDFAPVFNPIVDDYYSGMLIGLPLTARLLCGAGLSTVLRALCEHYGESHMIRVNEKLPENGFMPANSLSGYDSMELFAGGTMEQFTLFSRFDNLGKGASGAAIQCMNIMLGIDETTGLAL